MYSPKIKDELILRIYRLAKTRGLSMTNLLNEILRKALKQMEGERHGRNGRGFVKRYGKN